MDKIKKLLQKPNIYFVGSLLAGLFIGLFVLGWGVWPVEWVDASPSDLQVEHQRDYLCMVIDSYVRNQDTTLAQLRWSSLGEKGPSLLDGLTPAACRFSSTAEIDAFKLFANVPVEGGLTPIEEISLPSEVEGVGSESKISLLPLAILGILTLSVGGVFAYLMLKKSRQPSQNVEKSATKSKGEKIIGEQMIPHAPLAQSEPPLAQFMTTYRQGDDLYDDSFSVDSINGEFLGECGVGIAETIGVGDPKKVTALEIWLFDKNDIQTVTKVLMSEHASNDPAIRQRLLSKGEPILVEPGMKFIMETASLQLEARVVDMVYARGPLPENSYFSRLTLEISVWPK
jgi:hypothetical protein